MNYIVIYIIFVKIERIKINLYKENIKEYLEKYEFTLVNLFSFN